MSAEARREIQDLRLGAPEIRSVAFDLTRFIAAAIVVIYHLSYDGFDNHHTTFHSPDRLPLQPYGYLGVDVFFVISGYFIYKTAHGRDARSFIIARISRLAPSIAICASIVIAAALFLHVIDPLPAFSGWFGSVSLLSLLPWGGQVFGYADGVYWTLAIEFTFYGYVALLLSCGRRLGSASLWLIALFFISAGISRVYPQAWTVEGVKTLTLGGYSGHFLLGGAMFLIEREGFRRNAAMAAVATVIVAVKVYTLAMNRQLNPSLALLLLFVPVILTFALHHSGWNPVWRRWATLAGGISYPLYLIHRQLGYYVLNHLSIAPGWPPLIIAFFASILLAYIIHRFYEMQTIELVKSSFKRWWPARPVIPG